MTELRPQPGADKASDSGLKPRRVLAEGAKFGAVGATATLAHVTIFVLAIETLSAPAVLANLVAFCMAVTVSFIGNFYWTFRTRTLAGQRDLRAAFARFLVVALTGLALSSLTVYVVVEQVGLSHFVAAALMMTVVPALVFLLSKFWAFA